MKKPKKKVPKNKQLRHELPPDEDKFIRMTKSKIDMQGFYKEKCNILNRCFLNDLNKWVTTRLKDKEDKIS